MRYISTNGTSPPVPFREALFRGLAPDGGLYIPERLPCFHPAYFQSTGDHTLHSIGRDVAAAFIDDIPRDAWMGIIERAWDFAIPIRQLDESIFLLELFHGPTLAFKDVGARFMAETMSFLLQKEKRAVTILVATSGDTGSAVAHGFFGSPNIRVVVFYPSGKISGLQEQQMTTLGENIHAVEVLGTFDDCQRLVTLALADTGLVDQIGATTANSINIGRLIPQISYYVWGSVQLGRITETKPVVVVPSGNFGNLTAAVYAREMGTPLMRFVAATNVNDVVPEYLRTGTFISRPSVQTLSNAMDVGNPGNWIRLRRHFDDKLDRLREVIEGARITDTETLDEIHTTHASTGIVLDPHTAVGVRAARRYLAKVGNRRCCIVAATAHPAKFPGVLRRAVMVEVSIPDQLQRVIGRVKKTTVLPPDYPAVKEYLLGMKFREEASN